MAAVSFKQVTKRYDNGFQAVTDLDLDIEDGEFVVMVGPSGCGKSTTLRMIAGLETISEGRLAIGDRVVNDLEPRERDIAMVFQSYALYPHMTVAQNIGFALRLAKIDKAEIDRRVAEAAEVLELTPLLDRKPGQLSGGQRQRVAMGRAIVRRPQVFLMDEPLSNLDAKLRVQMRAEISRIQRSLGVTTFYVTHDQVEALTMGDRVAVIKAGVLQQFDTPKNLYHHPRNVFVGAFIGSPAMNLLRGVVGHDGASVTLGSSTIVLDDTARAAHPALAKHVGHEVVVGVRPEHLEEASVAGGAVEGATLKGEVTLVEALGSEQVVYVRTDASAHPSGDPDDPRGVGEPTPDAVITARLDPYAPARSGERIELRVSVKEMHFFDAGTTEAITE